MSTTKKERAQIISRLASEMAESGEYSGYQHIEIALRAKGYDEARSQLDSPITRKLLDEACRRARNTDWT